MTKVVAAFSTGFLIGMFYMALVVVYLLLSDEQIEWLKNRAIARGVRRKVRFGSLRRIKL